MTVIKNDFTEGRCCFLCGTYFENQQQPDETFAHGERVTCEPCWNALSAEGQSTSKKALSKTKVISNDDLI